MLLSNVSICSVVFSWRTIRFVSGRTSISNSIFIANSLNIRIISALVSRMPRKATGKKIAESRLSPQTVEIMARQLKWRPFVATFILLSTRELNDEPTTKAASEAAVVRGTRAKRELNAAASERPWASIGIGIMHNKAETRAKMMLSAKPVQTTNIVFL